MKVKSVIKTAESLGRSVTHDSAEWEFRKYSPAGQDFGITIFAGTTSELLDELSERCSSFDCSEEAYLWLDNTGHGQNGAPYDMKDLYEDMEACQEMLLELVKSMEEAA